MRPDGPAPPSTSMARTKARAGSICSVQAEQRAAGFGAVPVAGDRELPFQVGQIGKRRHEGCRSPCAARWRRWREAAGCRPLLPVDGRRVVGAGTSRRDGARHRRS